MTVLILVDTNVVLYSLDRAAPLKQARCAAWLSALTAANSMAVSPQVCNETRSAAERKLKLPRERAQAAAVALLPWCTAPLGPNEVRAAVAIETRWKTSWWDAILLASAAAARCTHFLTEDTQSAPEIAGVRILNPFQAAPEDILRAP
ncbi:MAG: PIN domain-containing protein [Hyphomonadaceae bacterium]|nr:PIN domain-containing protein [Hyphomonadaceae bacterium]